MTLKMALVEPMPNARARTHEWGTFTSVAGEDGNAVQWAPLSGTPDLPGFVKHLSPRNLKLAPGLVRMETPVLYFYAPRSMSLSVHVDFPQGWITEWYPQATQVKPEASANFQYVPGFGGDRLSGIPFNCCRVRIRNFH